MFRDELSSEESNIKSFLMRLIIVFSKFKNSLPLYAWQKDIIKNLEDREINIIAGETGCGKTILLPQIILEQLFSNQKLKSYNRIYVVLRHRLDAEMMAHR